MSNVRPQEAVIATNCKNVSLIPANAQLAEAEMHLLQIEQRNHQLKKALIQLKDDYDIIIVDCLPSLGILAINALIASDKFIVPMQCEHYSLEGLAQLLSTVKKVKKTSNKNLSLMGIVFTMLDKRLLQSNEIMRDIKMKFSSVIYIQYGYTEKCAYLRSTKPRYAVIYYDKSSKGAESYMKLAGEIIKKLND